MAAHKQKIDIGAPVMAGLGAGKKGIVKFIGETQVMND